MGTANRPSCYGSLFPDLGPAQTSTPQVGKAFTCTMHQDYGLGPRRPELEIRAEQWEQCVACEHYRSCYDLAAAKLMLSTGMRVRT